MQPIQAFFLAGHGRHCLDACVVYQGAYSDEDWKRKVVYLVYIAWNGMDLVNTKAMAYVNTYRGC